MSHSPELRILRLAVSFPTLRDAYGGALMSWDARQLDRLASQSAAEGARHAARFVLAVWNNAAEWECGRFDVVEAMAVWDAEHRVAFLDWVKAPWWA